MKIFSGSAHRELALRICQSVRAPLGDAVVSSFPDGETRVKINENIRGRDIFIVQPTCPPTNQNLMELLILIDAARRASAYRITAVIPYFGYARQDRKDQPRVPITAKLVANLLVAAGANRVLTLDLHAQQIQGFFDIPVDHLYAAPVLIRYIRQKNIENLVVVSPDVGGLTRSFYGNCSRTTQEIANRGIDYDRQYAGQTSSRMPDHSALDCGDPWRRNSPHLHERIGQFSFRNQR